MKILVICQYYAPEPFRHPDICEALVQRGHSVTVVTGLPNYPMGELYEGYRNGEKRDEVLNGVNIHRCFTIPRKHGFVYRILNYYSYVCSSVRYIRKLRESYDVVFVNQLSPVMMAYAALAYKKRHGVPIVLYCLDLWPESLVAGAIKRGSMIYRLFHLLSGRIYKRVDKILVTSRSFIDYFQKEFGICNTEYLPQYAEALFTPEQCRKKTDGYIDLMFAGNVGAAQKVATIIQAAALTSDIPNLRWHIVGDGSELANLQKQAAGLKQVFFHGRRPLSEMPDFYAMADAMLVTMQRDPVLSLTLPGKVQTYMAAGKPILCAADGETPAVITSAECGLCGPAEDAAELARNVREFIRMDHRKLGDNAKLHYDRRFQKQLFMDRLEECLKQYAVTGNNIR